MRDFHEFRKIPRLARSVIVTEKIDGTNASVTIEDDGEMSAASRSRYITPGNDNHGFAAWVEMHRAELATLGPGVHYGEWWGSGINRGYGLTKGDKRFSLFNVSRWSDPATRPKCCDVVPVLYTGPFDTAAIDAVLTGLARTGSQAAPGYMNPEGIVVYHVAGNVYFKKTIEHDDEPKGLRQ